MTSFQPLNPRIMLFIDGGYLRKALNDKYGKDIFDIHRLAEACVDFFTDQRLPRIIQRIYYFDGEVLDKTLPRFIEDKKYHDELRKSQFVEIITGDLVKTPDGWRQKGVDLLIGINMLTKAFLDHYDCAVLIAGDRDFKQLVYTIKNQTGKRVYGVYFFDEIPDDFRTAYDDYHLIDDAIRLGIV